MHGFNALRGLHGERGDGRDAVTVVCGKCLDVSGDTRSSGRIEARDRQYDWRSDIHMIGQFFESLREKNSPTSKWTCRKIFRASQHFEMYARSTSHAIEIFMYVARRKDKS